MTTIRNLDVEPIAQAIDDLAEDLLRRAQVLRQHAQALRETGDLDEVGSALSVAVSTKNMRLDLLVSCTLRQLAKPETHLPSAVGLSPAKKSSITRCRVFAGLTFVRGKQVRTVVATTSQKKAAELLGVSLGDIRGFWSGGSSVEQAMALAQPGVVFRSTGSRCQNFTAVPHREGKSE